jgi:two-component system nitrate/nitrite response regulator NarP
VLLVHPDPEYRARVLRLLTDGDCQVVGEASTSAACTGLVRDSVADVLVVARGTGDVGDTVRRARDKGLEVLILTMGPDEQFLVDMMLAGASGLVCDCNLAELPDAVHGVLVGTVPMPLQLLQGVMSECRVRLDEVDPHSPWLLLSDRQRQVMELLRRGYDTEHIAQELHLRPVTVRAHLAAAMHRLGVSSRADALAVLLAEEHTATPT